MIVLLLAALGADAIAPPTLCVALHAERNIELGELLAAMRARIARRDVRVVSCEKAKPLEITYRLEVVADSGNRVALAIHGIDLDARRTVSVQGMSTTEIVQTISLTAVEAVRPSMDKLLVEMGLLAPPEKNLIEEIEKQKCPEAEPCKQPEVVYVDKEVFRPAEWELGLTLGPMLGVDPDGASPAGSAYGALSPAVWIGSFGLALSLGLNVLPRQRASGASLQVSEVELAAFVLAAIGPVRVGVGAQNRLSTARASSGSPFLEDGTQFFWNGGFGLAASTTLWESESLVLGVDLRMWLWPQPNRFLFQGEPLVEQAHLELFLGPSLRYFFKS